MAYLSLPDGSYYEIPKGMSPQQARIEAYKKYPQAFGVQPEAPAKAKQPGIIESGVAGAKKLLSSQQTALGSLINPEEAAQAGLARARALEEKTPSALSLERVKEKYNKDGILSAAGEVLSQAPSFIAEQFPQVAQSFTTGRLGAMAGAPLGPYGAIGGGIAGAFAPLFLQSYGAGAERRAAEGLPQEPGKTALSATGQATLEYASMAIPFGRKLMGSILGLPAREAEQALLSPAARKLAEERLATSIAKGTGKGVLAEIPTEVTQQMLERWQANLPLLDDNAIKEYSEAAYGSMLFGGPFGAVGRRAQVSQAKEEVTRVDALEAAKKAKELREAEAAKKADPNYMLEVGDKFEALQQQEKALLAARGKKLGKDATDEQKELFAQQTEELQAVRNQLKELAPDYKEIKAKLPGLREERRIAGMSEQDYYYEQMGMKSDAQIAAEKAAKEKAAPQKDEMQDWLNQTSAQAKAIPKSQLQKELDTALDGLRHWGAVTPTDVAEVLADNPALMLKVYKGEISIPEFKAKDVQALKGILNLQMKDLASQMAQGRVAAGKTSAQIEEEKAALQRISEKPLPESKAATQLDLLKELEGYAGEIQPGVVANLGLPGTTEAFQTAEDKQKQDRLLLDEQALKQSIARADKAKRDADAALKKVLAGTDPSAMPEAQKRYADLVMDEVNSRREAAGQKPVDAQKAATARIQIATLLNLLPQRVLDEAAFREQLSNISNGLLEGAGDQTKANLKELTAEKSAASSETEPSFEARTGQKQNYRAKAAEHQEEASNALLTIQETKTDIEKGNTLDSPFAAKRKFASTTTDLLRQRIEDNKQAYVDALLKSAANLRAAENQQPIPADLAKQITAQVRSALDAYSTGQASEEQLTRQLAVARARLLTYRPAVQKQTLETGDLIERQSNYREAQRVAEERGETAQTLEGQLRRQRDYVGGLIERVVPTGTIPRNTRALLQQTQTAIEDGIATREVLDLAEDIATRVQRGQNTQAELPKLNAALRSMQQAQAPGIEGGQQSLFGTEDLGVVRATAANFRKFLNSKQVQALRALLPKVEAVVEKERTVRTGETSPGVDAEFYSKRIDALETRINEAKDSLEDLGGASWESIMETRAVLPEEVRVARQKLVALLQEQNKLEMEREAALKPKLKGTRPPYAAAQAKTKAAKLKDQIKNKEVSILQSIRDLAVKIRLDRGTLEQRGEALYGPIIQKFEQQAQVFEARLAELEAAMPEGGRMSPDLDDLFNEAEDLKAEIAKTRAIVQEARTRQEARASGTTEFNKEVLEAAEQALAARKAELRTANQTPRMSALRVIRLEKQVNAAQEQVDALKEQRRESNKEVAEDTSNEALIAAADERIVKDKARLAELQKKLANVDFVGEERRAAQLEANKLRRDTAVADGKLQEAKELQSRQTEERKRRAATGEGMQKLTRTVVPVEYTTKSGKIRVAKVQGIPLQRKKTTGAFAERTPVKGVNWKTTKESKPRYTPTEEVVEETTPKAQRVGAAENLKDIAKTAGTLARQANVTDLGKPKKVEPLRTGSAEAKEEKVTKKQTLAQRRALARDAAEGVTSEYDDDAGLAFRTGEASETVVDPAEAKKLIVEVLSTLPKGVNLVYAPTLADIKPDLLAKLIAGGYKEGESFKGVVLPDGTIVVVGDQHSSVTDMEETLFHEMVGHYGIDTVIGMDRLQKYANDTDVIKLAEKLGGDPLVRKALEAARFAESQGKSEEIQKLQALREVIAYTAQRRITEGFREKAGRWLKEFVGMVRSALRQMGFKGMARMSTSDVFYAIKLANKAFNERTVGPYRAADGLMAFRTKSEPSRYGGSFVAAEKSTKDKLIGNFLGLSGRVQFVDQYAALDAAMKKGLDAGVISDLEAEQAGYYLRFGQQANAYATQALTNGPLSLVKQVTKRGMEFVYKSTPGANMVKVAQALEKSGIKNSTELEQMFTIYVAGKRAKQLTGGWDKLNFSDPATAEADYNRLMAELRGNEKARAAFEEAAKIYKEYNNGLIDFAVQTGYLSAQKGAELKAIDYVPFYRVQGGELQLMVDKERPVRIANMKDEPILHELVGDNTQILPIFTSSAQNAFVLTRMGLRNQMMKDNVMLLGRLGIASKIGKGAGPQGPNTVRYKVKGEDNFAIIDSDMYGIPAELIVKGMEGIKTTIPMAIKYMGLPANWLRQFVTRNPAYAVRQAIRDPLTAWFTTGVDGVPVMNSMKELGKMVAGRSKEEIELMQAGAISSNVMTGDEQDMARAMRDMSLGRTGWSKLMMKADALALQGDAATRAVIYKDSLNKGMSEMQALMRTLESMNFSRRGLSPSMQMMSTVIPFFNAQIQGLDVLYRAFKGQMPYNEQLKIRQKLYTRGLLLAAGTLAYAAAMEDDEAYKRAKPEERLGNWFVYTPFSDEPMRVPIPFEFGYIFKSLFEAVYNTAAEDERNQDIIKGMSKLLAQSNPFALPAAIKPATEVVLGKSFFGGDIESMREKTSMMPGERYREGTTEIAKMLGSVTGDAGLTPIKIDYLIRGYTGALGIAIASLANPILNTEVSAVEKPTMKTSKTPFIGGLFQPVEGRGTLDAAYERMLEIEQAQGTYERLRDSGKKEEAEAFLEKYRNKVVAASLSGQVRQQLGELAKLRRQVLDSSRTTAEKDELLDKLDERQYETARRFLSFTGETRPQ
jgi:hypothetical protein